MEYFYFISANINCILWNLTIYNYFVCLLVFKVLSKALLIFSIILQMGFLLMHDYA